MGSQAPGATSEHRIPLRSLPPASMMPELAMKGGGMGERNRARGRNVPGLFGPYEALEPRLFLSAGVIARVLPAPPSSGTSSRTVPVTAGNTFSTGAWTGTLDI